MRALDSERDAFLARETPDAFVHALRRRSDAALPSAAAGWTRRAAQALAVAAALVAVILPLREATRDSSPAAAEVALVAMPSETLTLKGGHQVALIRERDGEQTFERRSAIVQPGDRLRVAFQLGARRRVAAGVLVDDGSWVPLFEGEFEAGAHAPEETLQVDEQRNMARVVFGSPKQVEAVRKHGDISGVQVIELIWRPRHEGS